MQTIVKKIELPGNKRIIVTSDVHGHYYHLKNLLEKVSFTKDDILFIVGDIIEKGPLSLQTLRYIMQLCEEYTVYPLMGNVDAYRLVMYDDDSPESAEEFIDFMKFTEKHWGASFFGDMCKELGISINSPEELSEAKKKIDLRFKEELEFLRGLPTIIETQKYIFVHGGLPSEDINSFAGTDVFTYLKNDAFMEKGLQFSKYLVVGHWPVTLYDDKISSSNPVINRSQRIISIDGGCGLKRDGQLNALIIPYIASEEVTFDYYDDFPVAIAQTAQEKSDNSINIRYSDNRISILEKGNEFSYAEHKSSGYRLWIHNDYIHNFDENAKCDDYTDYKIHVSSGDKVSLIMRTSKGYLIKKQGISGWYSGVLTET